MTSGFGLSEPKKEGEAIRFDSASTGRDKPDPLDYQWLERRVPKALHDDVNAYIDQQIVNIGGQP